MPFLAFVILFLLFAGNGYACTHYFVTKKASADGR